MVFEWSKNNPTWRSSQCQVGPKGERSNCLRWKPTINQRLAAHQPTSPCPSSFWSAPKKNPPICCGRDTWQTSCFFACLKMFRKYFFVIGSVIDILQQHQPKQTNKQTNKQTHTHTNKQTNKQTNKHTNKQTNKQTNKPTNQPNKQTNKQTQVCFGEVENKKIYKEEHHFLRWKLIFHPSIPPRDLAQATVPGELLPWPRSGLRDKAPTSQL